MPAGGDYDDDAPPAGPLNRIQDDAIEEAIQSIAERLPKQSRVQERLNAASRPTWDELTARRRAAVEREGFEESLNAEYRQQLQADRERRLGKLRKKKSLQAAELGLFPSLPEQSSDSESRSGKKGKKKKKKKKTKRKAKAKKKSKKKRTKEKARKRKRRRREGSPSSSSSSSSSASSSASSDSSSSSSSPSSASSSSDSEDPKRKR
eukprot:EG_transcript_22209